ncbi:MAG: flagellar basal body P-ring formation chaperone FlgA [Burkholderiales bacterium]
MTSRFFCRYLAGLMLLTAFPATASEPARQQEALAVRKAVENHLRRETAGLPGKVNFAVGTVETGLNLPACPALEPFVPPGNRLWGKASVGVRCNGATPWLIYVPVEVRVTAEVVHSARPLAQNQPLTESDITLQQADLTQMPAGILTDARHVLGKTLTSNVGAGQPLRHDMLRSPTIIQQNQSVKLVVQGRGFSVSAEGKALTAAAEGQPVQVRVQSGQVVSGVARAGAVVEMRP